MFFDYGSYEYYIRPGFTDMRCGSDSLARIVMEETGSEVYSRKMFLFLAKNRRTLAVLVWDRNGFWLMRKKLQSGTFPWPGNCSQAMTLKYDDIRRLLDGNDIFRMIPDEPYMLRDKRV